MASKSIKVALVGGGMYGREVVLRTMMDIEQCGIAPYLGTTGLDHHARDYEGVTFEMVAVGTRTAATAKRLVEEYRQAISGSQIEAFSGETPWTDILDAKKPDVLLVATPDHLHAEPIMAALGHSVHVVSQKPLTLKLAQVDEIIAQSKAKGLIVAVDMHKRYDSFLRSAFVDLVPRLGTINYGRAVLEEPLEISTEIFKWAASSNPFSYVGIHWLDLFAHYMGVLPASLHAVGQRNALANWRDAAHPDGIDTFDSMQVGVVYDNGMRIEYVNAWINPKDFEGPVNQEMEIVGTKGRVFVDQQDRGMRSAITGSGSRTHNPHFQAEVPRLGAPGRKVSVGYSKDSLIAGLEAATRVIVGKASRDELAGLYPDAETARSCVAILEAADVVARRNATHQAAGQGAPATAVFRDGSFQVIDPFDGHE